MWNYFCHSGCCNWNNQGDLFVTDHRSINKLSEHSINSGTGFAVHYSSAECFFFLLLLSKAMRVKRPKALQKKDFTSIMNIGNIQQTIKTCFVRCEVLDEYFIVFSTPVCDVNELSDCSVAKLTGLSTHLLWIFIICWWTKVKEAYLDYGPRGLVKCCCPWCWTDGGGFSLTPSPHVSFLFLLSFCPSWFGPGAVNVISYSGWLKSHRREKKKWLLL